MPSMATKALRSNGRLDLCIIYIGRFAAFVTIFCSFYVWKNAFISISLIFSAIRAALYAVVINETAL